MEKKALPAELRNFIAASCSPLSKNFRPEFKEALGRVRNDWVPTVNTIRLETKWQELEDFFEKNGGLPSQRTIIGQFANDNKETPRLKLLKVKYGIKTIFERAKENLISLEEIYKQGKRPEPVTYLGKFEKRALARNRKEILALQKRYGIVMENDLTEKWKKLESFYKKFQKLPKRSTEYELLTFEAGRINSCPDKIWALRKKYGIKNKYQIVEEKWQKLEDFYKKERAQPNQKTDLGKFANSCLYNNRPRILALRKKYEIKTGKNLKKR